MSREPLILPKIRDLHRIDVYEANGWVWRDVAVTPAELESPEFTRDYVLTKLKNYGVQVRDKVDLDTDFLVALKNYESTPEYKAAKEFRVTVLRERDLLAYIGQ